MAISCYFPSTTAKTLFCCCFLVILNAAQAQAQKNKFDLKTTRQQIEAANRTYVQRFQSDDPAFYAERYTADACIMPEKMERICGRDAIRAYYYNGGQNRDLRLDISTTEVSGGAESVVEEGTYALLDKAGATLDKGKFIATWAREAGKWKLRREIWTTDIATPSLSGTDYDPDLAQQLGADAYGMKKYVLVLLKTGPAKIDHKPTVDSLFAGHMANIGRMAEAKQLVLAGPIGRQEKYRGLYIFQVPDVVAAAALCQSDPAVAAGLLEPDIMPYYGSASLGLINDLHKKLQKKDIVQAPAKPAPQVRMKQVIALDDSLGKVRNRACERISLSETIRQYAMGLEKIDYSGCPDVFVAGFRQHREAWLALLPFTDRHAQLRGEMHDLFKKIETGPDGEPFKGTVKKVWDTWALIEAAMQ